MARLQDFQTVTPTDSDNLLVVQATGQGLATVGSTLGAKMNKADPTGTGSLSLNRQNNSVVGDNSSAIGTGTIANHKAQNVFGEYNLADTSTAQPTARGNYIEIVGKGTSDSSRSNARTLDWSGNEVLAGDLTINGNRSLNAETAYSSGTVTWNTEAVTGDNTRRVWQKKGHLVIVNLEFTPLSGKISNGTIICSGLPLPNNDNYTIFGGNSQQVKVTMSNLVWYFPSDTTTLRRTELLLVYFTN